MKLKKIIFLVLFVLLGFFIDKKLRKTEDKAEVALVYQERVDRVVETDVNKAELEDFLRLEISIKKAEKIIEFREAVGGIKDLKELERITGFGEKTVENITKNLVISDEKFNKKKFEINKASDELLLWYGFTKKEIKKIREYIDENGIINSNLEIKKLLSEEKYYEIKNLIIYTKY